MEGNITILSALGGGLLSFFTPCVLPMVPVYITSLIGADVLEDKAKRNRLGVFLHSLSFVLGFTIVYTFMGAAVGLIGFNIGLHLAGLYKIAGSILIFFGLFMLVALKVPWLNFERRLSPSTGRTTSYLRSLLTGAVFTFAWVACTAPILTSILALAMVEATAVRGAYLLAIYSLGLGLPFLAIGAALDSLLPLIKRIYRYSNLIYIIGGILLVTVGIILLLTNSLVWLRSLQNWIIWVFIVENVLILTNKFGWLGKLW
jgi:cytochrome c-type biogenesis protein